MSNADDLAAVIQSVTDRWDERLDEVHDIPPIVNAILSAGWTANSSEQVEKWQHEWAAAVAVGLHQRGEDFDAMRDAAVEATQGATWEPLTPADLVRISDVVHQDYYMPAVFATVAAILRAHLATSPTHDGAAAQEEDHDTPRCWCGSPTVLRDTGDGFDQLQCSRTSWHVPTLAEDSGGRSARDHADHCPALRQGGPEDCTCGLYGTRVTSPAGGNDE